MTQDFQSIGKASPALDELAAEKSGWQGDQPEPLIDATTDHEASQYNTRGRPTRNPVQPLPGGRR